MALLSQGQGLYEQDSTNWPTGLSIRDNLFKFKFKIYLSASGVIDLLH